MEQKSISKDWLNKELKFILWLYRYKNFLGRLKKRDFKNFDSKTDAVRQYQNETGVNYYE